MAIAIALANEPRLLLADEPTGSLDTATSNQVLDLFRTLNRTIGITIVIVTHDPELARKVDRVVQIRDGKTSAEMLRRISYSDVLTQMDADSARREAESHIEYAVLDKAGRLQIPAGYLGTGSFKDSNKVRVELEDGRIVLYPANERQTV
ncbi:hypothetical protein VQ056_32620 [Paenibacillus sp. JTLBN-2024]